MTFFKDTMSKKPHLVWYQMNCNPVWEKTLHCICEVQVVKGQVTLDNGV